MMATPLLLEGDVRCDLRINSVLNDYVVLEAVILSEKFNTIDLAFEYKVGSEWKRDAVLLASKMAENRLLLVGCNQTTLFRWYYPMNGLVKGVKFDARLRVLPQTTALLGSLPRVETISPDGRNQEDSFPAKVINFGFDRRQLRVSSSHFLVYNKNGSLLYSTVIANPVWAQEKRDGNFIVLTDAGRILEVHQSTVVRNVDYSARLTTPKYFIFDELTSNILVAGYDDPYVYEVAWGIDYGGNPLNVTSISLTQPVAATYTVDRSKILILDRADPPRLITLSWILGEISSTTTFSVNGTGVQMSSPFIPFSMEDGSVVVVEQLGENQKYSSDPTKHPALVRAGIYSGYGKDTLPDYSGLSFVPLPRNSP